MIVFKRLLMVPILLIGCFIIGGCVTVDNKNPLLTEKGKKEAIQAYIDLSYGYVKNGEIEQAKEPLLNAIKINPDDPDANAALAYVFQLEHDPVPAEQYFKKAVVNSNNDARILNNYGVFLVEQRRFDDAKKQFLKASEDPFYSGRSLVFENLGLISSQQNDLKAAESYFQRALLLNRNRVKSILSLADVYYRQGDYNKAMRYYNSFVATANGKQIPASLLLGIRLATALNDKAKISNYVSQLQQLYPDSLEYKAYKAGKK